MIPNDVYLNATLERNAAILDAYSLFAIDVAKVIRDEIKSRASDSQIARDVQQIIDFETKLADLLQSKSSGRRWDDPTNRTFQLDQLQIVTDEMNPSFNWTKYLNQVYSVVGIEVLEDEKVIVMEPNYVINLMALLRRTTPRVISKK
jgi:Peptidase family M13